MAATAGRPSLHPCHGNLAAVSIDPQHPAALACYRSRGPRLFGAGETVGRLPARSAILACLAASDFASRWASVSGKVLTARTGLGATAASPPPAPDPLRRRPS